MTHSLVSRNRDAHVLDDAFKPFAFLTQQEAKNQATRHLNPRPQALLYPPIAIMRHFVIHALNVTCLAIVLIGVPAATSVRFGSLQIGSRPAAEMVTLGMITLAFFSNFLGWLIVSTKRRERQQWIRWSFVHLILLGFQIAHFEGLIGFVWLKESLLWLKSQL